MVGVEMERAMRGEEVEVARWSGPAGWSGIGAIATAALRELRERLVELLAMRRSINEQLKRSATELEIQPVALRRG
jgi:hypothetical protein